MSVNRLIAALSIFLLNIHLWCKQRNSHFQQNIKTLILLKKKKICSQSRLHVNIIVLFLTVPPQCCSARLNLAFLMFLGFAVVYGLRVNLSVAMVAMVNTTDPKPSQNTSIIHACPLPAGSENTTDTFPQPEGVTNNLFSNFPFADS